MFILKFQNNYLWAEYERVDILYFCRVYNVFFGSNIADNYVVILVSTRFLFIIYGLMISSQNSMLASLNEWKNGLFTVITIKSMEWLSRINMLVYLFFIVILNGPQPKMFTFLCVFLFEWTTRLQVNFLTFKFVHWNISRHNSRSKLFHIIRFL